MEANVLDTEGLEYYTEKAMYKDGLTVKDAVAPETYAKLEQVAKLYELPMEQLELQKALDVVQHVIVIGNGRFF